MDPWALTDQALREPWRLWTGHLVHYGWLHALVNAVALLVPLVLVSPRERVRAGLMLFLLAPLLSLVLLPSLGGGAFRGASGLACALWALAGLRLSWHQESNTTGLLMLTGLGLKLVAEAALGAPVLLPAASWRTLPAAHLWGACLGLLGFLSLGIAPPPVPNRDRARGSP